MRNKNRVEIRGFLGADPTLTAGENGRNRATLNICTNYEYKTKDGETVSKPEWHRVVVWGAAADNVGKYLVKGSEAEIEGRLSTRQYEVKGETRYITEIVAEQINYGRRPTEAKAAPVAAAPAPMAKQVQRTTVRRKANEVTAVKFETETGDPW
jgi:single stranded DNA-binding protein